MTQFVRQIESDLPRIGDPLHLSLRLGETPMSAVGSKAFYGLPIEVARDLLMSSTLTWGSLKGCMRIDKLAEEVPLIQRSEFVSK